MRTYLVVIDDSDESRLALRYAARRAARVGGAVHVLAVIEPEDFVAWGGVQATIEAEARERAEGLVADAAGTVAEQAGVQPIVTVERGDPAKIVREILGGEHQIAALVLGSAASGNPGPLVSHFTGADAGSLPCPVFIIPGSLTPEEVDRLS